LSNAYTTKDEGNKAGSNRNGNSAAAGLLSKVEPYRLVHVGDMIEKFGRTLYWCPHHNDDKGIYVTHKPEDHAE